MKMVYEEKYMIEEELGNGGSGKVYKVYDMHLKCHMAMKRFEKADEISERELEIMKELRHAAVPIVTDCMEDSQYRYLFMEFIEGKNLDEYLSVHGPVTESKAVEWALELAGILIYLHELNIPIIYRDMKPANVIIDLNGKVRLVDFGTAIHYDEGISSACAGTYGYAAPEQLTLGAGQKADQRCDIYGLGATLFQMLTGCNPSRPPYMIQPIRLYNEGLSKGLESAVGKATMNERDRRYQTVRVFKEALEVYKKWDYLKTRAGSAAELAYYGGVASFVIYWLYRCSQAGILAGFTFYPAMLANGGIREEMAVHAVILLLLCMGKRVIRSIRRNGFGKNHRYRSRRLIKNVVLTEKKGKGLLISITAVAAALMLVSGNQKVNVSAKENENNLTVNVINERGQKILIRYDTEYLPEEALMLELPLSNFAHGASYELRLECTNFHTKEKSSRIFYLKGLEP